MSFRLSAKTAYISAYGEDPLAWSARDPLVALILQR